ncbi:MAG: ABC transporter ATP-binding protein [Ilumatobacteraceae bacterium]|nr:ABC transporter ATP-binding protein [Ilumatobacteraceae bacterium]
MSSSAASDSHALLSVRDLRTHFDVGGDAVKAVDGVSFDVHEGKALGIVGESGCGKTVLSRSIMGITTASNASTSGSVKYSGTELVGKGKRELRKFWGEEMAMVFQDPMTSLNPVVRIGRQLTEHLRAHKDLSKSEANDLAVQLLTWVRIPEPKERLSNFPHQMSGGMRQRVCIAIALACSPNLLFADEPTTALDVTVQHQILNLLAQQQQERQMGMVLVTHDLGVVATRTDDIAVMYAGKIVEKASTSALFSGMRHPYTQSLFWSIPKTSEPKHTRLSAIVGRPPNLAALPSGCSFADRCPYVQPICREVEPQLQTIDSHSFACHLPVGSSDAEAALSANISAGLPQSEGAATRREAHQGTFT